MEDLRKLCGVGAYRWLYESECKCEELCIASYYTLGASIMEAALTTQVVG